jgi:hypothetical protein
VGGGVQIGPLGTAATNRTIVPAPGDSDDGVIGGMIGKGNRSTRRKPAPMPLCPPQTPHAARKRIRAAAVGSQRLTAWATGSYVRIPLEAWMSVCVYSVCVVLCVGRGLATGCSPVQGVLSNVYRLRNWKRGQGPTGAVEPQIDRCCACYTILCWRYFRTWHRDFCSY